MELSIRLSFFHWKDNEIKKLPIILSTIQLIILSIIIVGCGTGFCESGSNSQGMHGKCNGFECAVPSESENWAFMGTVGRNV